MNNDISDNAYLLIIGAMKCGTTSLFSYLQEHPEICPAIVKEPEFFSEKQQHGVKTAQYSDLWDFDPTVHKYAMEASTGYTKFPYEQCIPEKIFLSGIRPKFIYIVRNPYERIASHYNFVHFMGWEQLGILDPHFIELSDYFLQLEQYRKFFPIEDFLILDFDDLKTEPALTLQKIYRFLDLSASHLPAQFSIENVTPFPLELRVSQLLKETQLNLFYRFLPQFLRNRGKLLMRTLSLSNRRTLTNAEKDSVHDKLKDGMSGLYHTYGYDVRKWGFDF